MDVINLFADLDWESENDRDGYRHRVTAVGRALGAQLLGGSVYEVPPGEKTWPYHYEVGCEGWVLVLPGHPTLRSPDGLQELAPGDLAVFPEGPAGAHSLGNDTDETCRVLFLSSKSPLAMIHYPDSNKVGLWSQSEGYEAILSRKPSLDYWHGEV